MRGGVAVEYVSELGDCRGDFEAEVEDLLLASGEGVIIVNYGMAVGGGERAYCRRIYSGHLTIRDRFRRGCISCPIPKLRGRFSMRGFYQTRRDHQYH